MSARLVTYWLSYGGGVNSTALMVMLCNGTLPQYEPFRFVFADTRDEKDETYTYIDGTIRPWLRERGHVLETACGKEGVLQRWQRISVTGSRLIRSCTVEAKIDPIRRHIEGHTVRGHTAEQLIGIDFGEAHRARPILEKTHYPLVDLAINRAGCVKIIEDAGLPVPVKSGCWHCPFMRVGEILALAKDRPDRFSKIVALEAASELKSPPAPGERRTHWGDRPALEWAARACSEQSSGPLFQDVHPDLPCACYDGEIAHE